MKALRKRAGLSTAEVAAELGFKNGSGSYRRYERGETEPSGARLLRLAELYGVTVEHLLCADLAA